VGRKGGAHLASARMGARGRRCTPSSPDVSSLMETVTREVLMQGPKVRRRAIAGAAVVTIRRRRSGSEAPSSLPDS
jgi:hypothetical protein